MELFNEVKNRYFHLVFQILSLAKNGLTEEEIIKIVDKEEYEEKLIGKDFKTFDGLLLNEYKKDENFNLLVRNEKKFYPIINNKDKVLPVRFTLIEKIWLKNFINDNTVKRLLGEEIIKKLEEELKDVENIEIDSILDVTNAANRKEKVFNYEFEKNFWIIVEGIIKEKPICYCNVDREGKVYKNKLAIPLRIEYSIKSGNFLLSIYDLKENRPILVNINTMSSVSIEEDIPINITRKEIRSKIKKERYSKEPIVIELEDKRGAMERFFMSFSQYERTARNLEDKKYEIKVNYYNFEEEEIIDKIVSLGPFVKVISPIDVKNKVIKKVVRALELCEEE